MSSTAHPRLATAIIRPRRMSLFICLLGLGLNLAATPATSTGSTAPNYQELSLDECLATARTQNRRRPASQFAVAAAEAQHRQALSGYWPQVVLSGGVQRLDEAPNFVFPPSMMGLPAQSVTTPASTAVLTIPAGVLGPTAVQLPVAVPAQTVTTPAQVFPVPSQNVRLMDPTSELAAVNAKWLLFDGGMRSGLNLQAESLVTAMKEEARRTDLEIDDTVFRLYYGAVLARQLQQLGADTLARMEATLNLTETMYKEGSGKVTKSDYLDNKVMVESLRAMVALLEKNEAISQAALANSLGLSWQASVRPKATELPFAPFEGDLGELVGTAYRFNPDWQSLDAGLRARAGAVQTARSGHYPKVALTGEIHRWWNGYDAGVATAQNKQGWTVGLGFELPIFDGGLTRAKVAEMSARLNQLKAQGLLLKEGIGLQVKDVFLGLISTQKSSQATMAAMQAAMENRELTTRAYQNELVETEKVIRSQLMEALMSAQHFKARYDHLALQSRLSLLLGTEMNKALGGE